MPARHDADVLYLRELARLATEAADALEEIGPDLILAEPEIRNGMRQVSERVEKALLRLTRPPREA